MSNKAKKIDLMIVGAQKAGTTSLKNYLNEHPNIIGHNQIEFSYFGRNEEYHKGYELAYKNCFDINNGNKVIAKYVGIYSNEIALQRLKKHNPNCIIVFVVRDPVKRAYSAFNMGLAKNNIKYKDFNDITSVVQNNLTEHEMYRYYIRFGLYDVHIENIYKYFPKENVKIILFEELKNSTSKVCKEIFQKLEIDKDFTPNVNLIHNKTFVTKSNIYSTFLNNLKSEKNVLKVLAKKTLPTTFFYKFSNFLININLKEKEPIKMSAKTEKILNDYFKPHNMRFMKLTGINVSNWIKQ